MSASVWGGGRAGGGLLILGSAIILSFQEYLNGGLHANGLLPTAGNSGDLGNVIYRGRGRNRTYDRQLNKQTLYH